MTQSRGCPALIRNEWTGPEWHRGEEECTGRRTEDAKGLWNIFFLYSLAGQTAEAAAGRREKSESQSIFRLI